MTDQETIAKFEQSVTEAMTRHKLNREAAVLAVRRREPELARQYVICTQRSKAARRLADESLPGV